MVSLPLLVVSQSADPTLLSPVDPQRRNSIDLAWLCAVASATAVARSLAAPTKDYPHTSPGGTQSDRAVSPTPAMIIVGVTASPPVM
jgi:hypothetical protein